MYESPSTVYSTIKTDCFTLNLLVRMALDSAKSLNLSNLLHCNMENKERILHVWGIPPLDKSPLLFTLFTLLAGECHNYEETSCNDLCALCTSFNLYLCIVIIVTKNINPLFILFLKFIFSYCWVFHQLISKHFCQPHLRPPPPIELILPPIRPHEIFYKSPEFYWLSVQSITLSYPVPTLYQ